MSEQPALTDLMEHAKDTVERIAADFDEPDADFLPTLLVRAHNDKVVVVGLDWGMDSQDEKDLMARFMLAACACGRAKEVAFVSSAWAVKSYTKDEYDSGDFVMPSEHPDRVEVVNVMFSKPDGDLMASREIIRHEAEGKPPTLAADWELMGGDGTKLGGRFGDAIHNGMELGRHLASDETPPEIIEYMDEMLAKGEFEELVRSFLRGMDAAEEMRRNTGRKAP